MVSNFCVSVFCWKSKSERSARHEAFLARMRASRHFLFPSSLRRSNRADEDNENENAEAKVAPSPQKRKSIMIKQKVDVFPIDENNDGHKYAANDSKQKEIVKLKRSEDISGIFTFGSKTLYLR